jgi:hypothetical protein
VIDFRSFENIPLRGGFTIVRIELASDALIDALGREAIARTRIVGRKFEIAIKSDLTEEEQSVTLYHEILEAATVASPNPPSAVIHLMRAILSTPHIQRMNSLGLHLLRT